MPAHLYKYVSPSTLLKVLETGTLRWSISPRFNDPFDMQMDIGFAFTRAEFAAALTEEIAALVFDRPQEPNDSPVVQDMRQRAANGQLVSRQSLHDWGSLAAPQAWEQLQRDYAALSRDWQRLISTILVLCLTEVPDDLLMWAHYSKDHTGGVLRLVADNLDVPMFAEAQPVTYSDTLPLAADLATYVEFQTHQIDSLDGEGFTRRFMLTKSSHWAYEREWRSLTRPTEPIPDGFEDRDFPRESLDGIFLGCRCGRDVQDKVAVVVAADYPHVDLFRMVRSTTEFSILPEPVA